MKIKVKFLDNSVEVFDDVLCYKIDTNKNTLEITMNNPRYNRFDIHVKSVEIINEEPMNTFKKSDLKTGMMVQMANNNWYLVLTNSELISYYNSTLSFFNFNGEDGALPGSFYDDNLNIINNYPKFSVSKVASCGNFHNNIIDAFVNHSDPTAIPGFHIIWSRESNEKAKVISVIEGLQKELDDAKRKLEELG